MVAVPQQPRLRLARVQRAIPGLLLLILFVALTVWSWRQQPRTLSAPSPGTLDEPFIDAVVERVVDGDTVVLANGQRIRLLGIDTPETKHPDRPVEAGGAEATLLLRQLAEGQPVRLEFDKHRFDRHGRGLAYLFRGDTFINAEMVRAGWSRADLRFPLRSSYKQKLRAAEGEARMARRGLWSNPSTEPR
jgi:micrococcal nuclease